MLSLTSSSACTAGKNELKADETDAKSDEPSEALLLAETVNEVDMARGVGVGWGLEMSTQRHQRAAEKLSGARRGVRWLARRPACWLAGGGVRRGRGAPACARARRRAARAAPGPLVD